MKNQENQALVEESMRHVLVEFKVDPKRLTESPAIELAINLAKSVGIEIDETYIPVPINSSQKLNNEKENAKNDRRHFVFRTKINIEKLDQIKKQKDVVEVWNDALIEMATPNSTSHWCPGMDRSPATRLAGMEHFGSMEEIMDRLHVRELWEGRRTEPRLPRVTGNRIVVGVVDGGINASGRTSGMIPLGTIDNVVDGWSPSGSASWGTASFGINTHGNAMAKLVQTIAPDCDLLDMRIFSDSETPFHDRVGNALQAYHWAIHRTNKPHILTNSWCLFRRDWFPIEERRDLRTGNYAQNMNHPFTRKVIEAIDAGIIVLFCAGNCGEYCADGRCFENPIARTKGNIGPRNSIWGANAHPLVMTVGSVTKHGSYIGESSQGPAQVYWDLATNDRGVLRPVYQLVGKPDFSCFSAFSGGYYTGTSTPNSGTSSATALTAGIIALLKEARPEANQSDIKNALIQTAGKIFSPDSGNPNPNNTGAGFIRPVQALEELLEVVHVR